LIVVLASRYDTAAQRLVERWADHDARLLTCDDLSVAGWHHHLADRSTAAAVIGGRQVRVEKIRGVVTRLPWVTEQELASIDPTDRAYVATEMSAFLTFWLSDLNCRVLNQPSPGTLNGPCWRREQWMMAGRRAGMRVAAERRALRLNALAIPPNEAAAITATVVGGRCLGPVHSSLSEQALRLADAAAVELLGVRFSSPHSDATFLDATLYPDLESVDTTDAILRCFAS
jgi:hypothetical protein